MTTTRPAQTPLTLTDVLKDSTGQPVPLEKWAQPLEEYGDITLFAGHITEAEANRRLAAQDQTLSGLMTVQDKIRKRWALFEKHSTSCPRTGNSCTCDQPWYVRWTRSTTPGAIPVSTALADADWDAA